MLKMTNGLTLTRKFHPRPPWTFLVARLFWALLPIIVQKSTTVHIFGHLLILGRELLWKGRHLRQDCWHQHFNAFKALLWYFLSNSPNPGPEKILQQIWKTDCDLHWYQPRKHMKKFQWHMKKFQWPACITLTLPNLRPSQNDSAGPKISI